MLGERRDTAAIETMIDVLNDYDPDDFLHGALTNALGKMGRPALEPLLQALDDAPNEELRLTYLSPLSNLGVHDARVKKPLVDLLTPNPMLAATLLAQYADPATIPVLNQALDALSAAEPSQRDNPAIIEVITALEELAGDLTPAQQALHNAARDQMREDQAELRHLQAERLRLNAKRQHLEAENQELRHKIRQSRKAINLLESLSPAPHRNDPHQNLGRNDPCWCGSGKKYKRCHWAVERR